MITPALRTGLAALLRAEPDFDVVAEAADGIQAVETALSHKPDVILMDLALPKKNGTEAIRKLLHSSRNQVVFSPPIPIMIISMKPCRQVRSATS